MSKENVKKFYDLAKKDEKMAEKLAGIEGTEGIMAFAKEKGLEFTVEEHEKYMEEVFSNTELTDDEVDAAAGGFSLPKPKVPKIQAKCNQCSWTSGWELPTHRNIIMAKAALHLAQKRHIDYKIETAMKPLY